MTDLISDFREKSVKKNELEDTDDLLESSVPTRQYFCHKREGKVKAESCHNQEKTQCGKFQSWCSARNEVVDS